MRISDRSSDVCSSDLSLLDDIPHDLPVHSKIVVDQTVAHSGDLRPFDLWMVRAKLRRQPFCRLAENLEVPNHRVLRPDVAKERSEERRVGKECVSTGRCGWSPDQ